MYDPKRLVAQGYDTIADRYTVWAQQVRAAERARYTHLLLQTLPAQAALLELGCGAGLPTTRTFAEHFRVTGVDLSAQQLARAKRQVPTATFIHADITRLAFTRACFDAVVAFYALMHVPRQEYAALFHTIASWVRPGGWFLATRGLGDLEAGLEADWLGVPMYWSSFDRATSLRLLHEAGFVIQRACEETADEDGVAVTFLWVLGRREDEAEAVSTPGLTTRWSGRPTA
jgi:cyclopropane fatty-acyl-phospholipid synthase-like methyltransferase